MSDGNRGRAVWVESARSTAPHAVSGSALSVSDAVRNYKPSASATELHTLQR